MFGRRPDASLVRDVSPLRRFMPFISPRRNESLVYFAQEIDVESALRFLDDANRERPEDRPITLFHLILRTLVIVFDERPRVNRFTKGGRLWQRDGIWFTFSAKMRFDDDGAVITVKRRFDPGEGLEVMVDALHEQLRRGRSGRKTTADKEVSLLLRLPPFLTRVLVWFTGRADALGLLPRRMIEADPMHATAFVANLGSVGLEAAYHHLWEYGTLTFFGVIGRTRTGSDGRRRLTMKWSFDERVEDGFYCARSLERVQELLRHPEKL